MKLRKLRVFESFINKLVINLVVIEMWKKGFLVLIIFLLSSCLVGATSFDVTITPIKDSILPGEQAEFSLTVTNNQNEEHHFGVSVKSDSWSPQSLIGGMRVPAKSSKTETLILSPTKFLSPGIHKIHVIVRDSTIGESVHKYPSVTSRVSIPTITQYLEIDPVVPLVDVPEKVDPRSELVVTINMKNRDLENSTKFLILLESKLIQEELDVTLDAGEKRTHSHSIKLDPKTASQKDILKVTFMVDKITLSPVIRKDFEVVGYAMVKEEKKLSGFFLRRTTQLIYFNDGNEPETRHVEVEATLLQSLFTKTEPSAFKIRKEGKNFLAWDLSFEPGETKIVTYTVNYIPLFLIITAIIIGVILYYLLRSPVVIRKEAFTTGVTEEGISEIKVLLHLKNRTDRSFEKAVLIDRIPDIVVVSKEVKPGTLPPTKVYRHEREGTVVKWKLGTIEKREERIISYKIKSKLAIIGGVRLPPALLKFYDEKANALTTKSNSYMVAY